MADSQPPVDDSQSRRGKALDSSALDQLFYQARSYSRYTDKAVPNEKLAAVWDLLKMAPTSANCLPARIVWAKSAAAKQQLADCAIDSNVDKILAAPVTAIIAMDMRFYELLPELYPHTDARSWFVGNAELAEATAFRNSSLQGGYFIIAARALGLDVGPMSGFDNQAVDKIFFAEQPHVRSNFICTVGYGDAASLHARSPRPDFARFNRVV